MNNITYRHYNNVNLYLASPNPVFSVVDVKEVSIFDSGLYNVRDQWFLDVTQFNESSLLDPTKKMIILIEHVNLQNNTLRVQDNSPSLISINYAYSPINLTIRNSLFSGNNPSELHYCNFNHSIFILGKSCIHVDQNIQQFNITLENNTFRDNYASGSGTVLGIRYNGLIFPVILRSGLLDLIKHFEYGVSNYTNTTKYLIFANNTFDSNRCDASGGVFYFDSVNLIVISNNNFYVNNSAMALAAPSPLNSRINNIGGGGGVGYASNVGVIYNESTLR